MFTTCRGWPVCPYHELRMSQLKLKHPPRPFGVILFALPPSPRCPQWSVDRQCGSKRSLCSVGHHGPAVLTQSGPPLAHALGRTALERCLGRSRDGRGTSAGAHIPKPPTKGNLRFRHNCRKHEFFLDAVAGQAFTVNVRTMPANVHTHLCDVNSSEKGIAVKVSIPPLGRLLCSSFSFRVGEPERGKLAKGNMVEPPNKTKRIAQSAEVWDGLEQTIFEFPASLDFQAVQMANRIKCFKHHWA